MTTIIYAHPYDKSFNHAILEKVLVRLQQKGETYKLLDLYADGFNPVMEADSLKLYSRGETADPLADKYLETLMASNKVIFIFPIWWGSAPAIVKGFFDKVMLNGRAYGYGENGLIPCKINMKRTLVLTTSESPTEYFAAFFRDYMPSHILTPIGMPGAEWYNCEGTSHGPAENREQYLKLLDKII